MRFLSILVASLLAASVLSGCFGDDHDHDDENGGGGTTTTTTGTTSTTSPTGAVNRPPVADFSFEPEEPVAAENVSFDGSASADPDGDELAFNWDFGDGSEGSGITPTHKFDDDGAFNVTLTVTDPGALFDTKTVQIVVLAGAGTVSQNETFNKTGTVSTPNPGWDAPGASAATIPRNQQEWRDTANDTTGDSHSWFQVNVNGTPTKLVITVEYAFTGTGTTISPVIKGYAYPPGWGASTAVTGNTAATEIASPATGEWNICVAMIRQLDPTLPDVPFYLNVTAVYPAE